MASFGLCVSSVSVDRSWVRMSVQITIAKTAMTEVNATAALRFQIRNRLCLDERVPIDVELHARPPSVSSSGFVIVHSSRHHRRASLPRKVQSGTRYDPSVDAEGRRTSAVVHIHGGLAATCNLKTHARHARGVRKVDEGRIVKA